MLLTTAYAYQERGYETDADGDSKYELQPAILGVCRQTYHEARAILYDENMWIVVKANENDWPYKYDDEGSYLPVVSRKDVTDIKN